MAMQAAVNLKHWDMVEPDHEAIAGHRYPSKRSTQISHPLRGRDVQIDAAHTFDA